VLKYKAVPEINGAFYFITPVFNKAGEEEVLSSF